MRVYPGGSSSAGTLLRIATGKETWPNLATHDFLPRKAGACLFRNRTPSPMDEGLVIIGKWALKGSKSSSTAQYASLSATGESSAAISLSSILCPLTQRICIQLKYSV